MEHGGRDYVIDRYPPSGDRSLRAFSAADEHILSVLAVGQGKPYSPLILHDRFGAMAVPLSGLQPTCIVGLKSQEISIQRNLETNRAAADSVNFLTILDEIPPASHKIAVMRVPKSFNLFRLYLHRAARGLQTDGRMICGFMTRYFSPALLDIAGEYFTSIEQSRAWKKSRLLILTGPKLDGPEPSNTAFALDDGTELRQHPGVFSEGRLDRATELLMTQLPNLLGGLPSDGCRILDLGCGNGVLSLAAGHLHPRAEIHAMDDSIAAVESARLNLTDAQFQFHWTGSLDGFGDAAFDAVITNPPFHFEHEIDISIPLRLFEESRRLLKPGGRLLITANRHLNYSTHLAKSYAAVNRVAEDAKYEVLRAVTAQ